MIRREIAENGKDWKKKSAEYSDNCEQFWQFRTFWQFHPLRDTDTGVSSLPSRYDSKGAAISAMAAANCQNILKGAGAVSAVLRRPSKILSVLKNSFKKSLDIFPKFGYNIIVKRKKEDRFPETFSEKEKSKWKL